MSCIVNGRFGQGLTSHVGVTQGVGGGGLERSYKSHLVFYRGNLLRARRDRGWEDKRQRYLN